MRFLYKHDLKVLQTRKRNLHHYVYETTFRKVLNTICDDCTDSNKKTLDLGCAQGNVSMALSARGCYCVGLDLRRSFLKYAQMKVEPQERKCLDWICADAYNLPFKPGSFNCVIAREILEHFSRPEDAMLEVKRVLSFSGNCLITTPNGERLSLARKRTYSYRGYFAQNELEGFECKPSEHVFEFTTSELYDLLSACGFKIEKFEYLVFIYHVLPFFLRLPLPLTFLRRTEDTILSFPSIGKTLAHTVMCIIR